MSETGKSGFGLQDVTDGQDKVAASPVQMSAPTPSADLVAALKKQIADLEEKLRGGSDSSLSLASSKKRIRIRIEQARDSSEPNPVFVGVNGRGYSIKRGVQVDVPPEVPHVLDLAVHGVGVPLEGGGVEFVEGLRINYTTIGVAIDEDGVELLPKLPYQLKSTLN